MNMFFQNFGKEEIALTLVAGSASKTC